MKYYPRGRLYIKYYNIDQWLDYTYDMYTYSNIVITFYFNGKKYLVTPVIFNEDISINNIILTFREYLKMPHKSKKGLIKFFNKNGISCKLKINKPKKSKVLYL